jgi:hypothetical protein
MNTKLIQSLIAGIIATAVMTFIMFVAPLMGMPKMNPAAMLSRMMGMPILVGWLAHFMIGVIFAATYVYFLNSKIRIANKIVKGMVFGFIVFIFAQIAMAVMGALIGELPEPEGSMIMMMIGSIMGHLVFGIFVALTVKTVKLTT